MPSRSNKASKPQPKKKNSPQRTQSRGSIHRALRKKKQKDLTANSLGQHGRNEARSISRKDAKEINCHFDSLGKAQNKIGEKSFLHPSLSLGMTVFRPSTWGEENLESQCTFPKSSHIPLI